MTFEKVGKVLQKVAVQSGDPDAMEAAYVVEKVNAHIGEIFGEKAVGNVKAVKYKDEVLTLGFTASIWAQESIMRAHKLKKLFNKIVIKKISYELVS